MAYKHIARDGILWGTNGQTFYTQLMNDLDSIDGWFIHDNGIAPTTSSFFVMRMETSEGPGNELYVRFGYRSNGFDMRLMEGWNTSTKVPDTAFDLNGQYSVTSAAANAATALAGYRISGDEDHAGILIYSSQDSGRFLPIYIGLIDKAHPEIDQIKKVAVCMGYHFVNNPGLYDTSNRNPIMRGIQNNFNAYGRTMYEYPRRYTTNVDNWLAHGPWGPDKVFFTSRLALWEDGFGLRGWLKSFRMTANQSAVNLPRLATVNIKGDEFIWWGAITEANTTIGQWNTWGDWTNQTLTDHRRQGWLLRGNP